MEQRGENSLERVQSGTGQRRADRSKLGIFQGQEDTGTEETEWEAGRVGEKQMPSLGTSSSDEMAAAFSTGVYH